MSDDFKLQFYFNILKDKHSRNRVYFKAMFEAQYGKFEKIDELISMIENYQIKKYGTMLYKYDLSLEEKALIRKINANKLGEEKIGLKQGRCRRWNQTN